MCCSLAKRTPAHRPAGPRWARAVRPSPVRSARRRRASTGRTPRRCRRRCRSPAASPRRTRAARRRRRAAGGRTALGQRARQVAKLRTWPTFAGWRTKRTRSSADRADHLGRIVVGRRVVDDLDLHGFRPRRLRQHAAQRLAEVPGAVEGRDHHRPQWDGVRRRRRVRCARGGCTRPASRTAISQQPPGTLRPRTSTDRAPDPAATQALRQAESSHAAVTSRRVHAGPVVEEPGGRGASAIVGAEPERGVHARVEARRSCRAGPGRAARTPGHRRGGGRRRRPRRRNAARRAGRRPRRGASPSSGRTRRTTSPTSARALVRIMPAQVAKGLPSQMPSASTTAGWSGGVQRSPVDPSGRADHGVVEPGGDLRVRVQQCRLRLELARRRP